MKPEDLDKAIRKGDLGPLYCLCGEEQYLVDRAAQRLLERAVDPGFRDFNLNVFYGNECKGEEIIEASQTLPMFAERRVVVVKRAGDLPAAAQELLLAYVKNPAPTTCLLFQAGKIDQRRKLFSELKKADALVEYKRLYENQVAGFLREEASAAGVAMEPAAAELLVYFVGTNLRDLVSQLEKLVTYCSGRPRIGVADVKAIVSDTKVDSVFELANAVGQRDATPALRRLQTVCREGDAPYMLVGVLARHFRQLWTIREQLDKRVAFDEISKRTGVSAYFLKGMVEQAKNFRASEFREIFTRLHETDLALKSSGGNPQMLLELLVLDLCQKRA